MNAARKLATVFCCFFSKKTFFLESKNQRAFVLCISLLLSVPAEAEGYKIATWNIAWLTLRGAGDPALPADVRVRAAGDFGRLRGFADRLDADVVAFQEVDGAEAARRVFDPARFDIVTIDEDVVQRVGLAVRHGIVVERHADVAALDVEPAALHRLRDGLDATLRFPDGARLRVLVVHLKTGCHTDPLTGSQRPQCTLLAAQWRVMAAWARARAAEGVPFALLGDFNRVLDRPGEAQALLDAAAPLLRVTAGQSDPCWEGGAFIDHIFLGGAARGWLVPGSVRVMRYGGAPAADRWRLSDHCPVSVRVDPR
jgi:endonuclease/exonuclease/phosphatase family metal-dependent hydrolase